MPALKAIGAWLLRAACAGMALGIATRVAMRLVALQADVPSAFSLGGSVEVVLLGTIVGAPAALVYWGCRHRFRLPPWSGVIAALLLFAALAARPTPAARSALGATADAPLVTAAIFGAAFVVYGVVLEVLWRLNPLK